MNDIHNAFQQENASVQPQKASVAIYEQIRAKILSGELKPGDKLPAERDLIEMFQRSRPTVREALRMLENKNYVSISRGRGTTVNKLSTDEIEKTLSSLVRLNLVSEENILDIRTVCETLAISLAARNRTEQDVQVLQNILKGGDQSVSFEEFMDSGIQFNGAIAKASHNEMLYLVIRITSSFSHDKPKRGASKMTQEEHNHLAGKINQQHHEMLEAIIAQDCERAAELNRLHLQGVSGNFYNI